DELRLAQTLAEAMTVPASHLAGYRDTHQERLAELIAVKVGAQRDALAPSSADRPRNLTEALVKSIELARASQADKPPRLTAPSAVEDRESNRQSGSDRA